MVYDFYYSLLFGIPVVGLSFRVLIPLDLISPVFAFCIAVFPDVAVFVTAVVSVSASVLIFTDNKHGLYWKIYVLLNYVMV